MTMNNYPKKLVKRVLNFHEMLWHDFQGIDEQNILRDLPESLRHEIRSHMLKNLI